MNAAMYCTTDCRRVDVPQTDRERPTSGRRGGSGGRVRPLQLQLRLRDCCLGARSLARLPARPPALSLARKRFSSTGLPPSASLPTRPLAPSSPTLLCTPIAEGGRKRKGGWRQRKRLAPFASPFHRHRHRKHAQVGEEEGEAATVSSVAMPSPLPRSSSSTNWREFLCFHNGGRARPARLPAPLPPFPPRDPSRVGRAYRALRFPQSLRARADERSAAPSFHRHRVFLPPTLSPPHSV